MATALMEGFGLYNVGNLSGQGSLWVTTSNQPQIQTAIVRNGTRALRVISGIQNMQHPLPSSNTYAVHAAVYFTGIGNPSPTRRGLDLRCTIDDLNIRQVDNQPGVLGIFRGATLIAAANGPIATSVWHSLEMTIANGTTVTWAINGVQQTGAVIVDIGNVLNINCGGISTGGDTYWDDIFCRSGESNLLGDTVIFEQFPDADTAQADWTVVGAASGFEALNNVPRNASEYIEATTVADSSTFDITNITESLAGVWAVGIQYNALKSTAGNGSAKATLLSGTGQAGGADNALTQSAAYYQDYFDQDPDNGGQPWLPTALDGLQINFERTL